LAVWLPAVAFVGLTGAACNELFGITEGFPGTVDGGGDGAVPPGDATLPDASAPETAAPDSTTLDSTSPDSTTVADAADGEAGCADPHNTLCNGACVSLTNDDSNCGACGHSCQHAGCAFGTCLPVTLVAFQNNPFDIAVDSTNVYWTDSFGSISGVPITGGTPFMLATERTNASSGFAADGTNVYWTERGTYDPDAGWYDGSVMMVTVDGGRPAPLAQGQRDPASIAVDGIAVYWADNSAGAILAAAVDGGTPTPLATGLNLPWSIATDGTSVYCTNVGDGTITKVPIDPDAGAPVLLVFTQDNIWTLAVAGGNVYWLERGPKERDSGFSKGAIMQVPVDGGLFVKVASADNAAGIAADSTHVYWTQVGAVMSVPVDGGSPSIIASGQQQPGNVAVDGTNVYWTDPMAGTVMKRVK
jgi:hypothetical protein